MSVSTSTKRVLERVPRVGFYPDVVSKGGKPWPEDVIFPSCMRALMEYLGHPEYDYIHFIGVTGAAAFLNWKDGWHPDNTAIYYMAPVSEHIRLFDQAFASTGYAYQVVQLVGTGTMGEDDAKRRIIDSIDRGVPVLSHGVVGPPETCLICGYDDAGDTLIGWSFFQGMPHFNAGAEYEPNGMFRARDWFERTHDLFLVGERGTPLDGKTVRRRSLHWLVDVARTPVTWDDRHNGLAAFDAWAEHLLRDGEIASHDAPGYGPFEVHDDAVGTLAENRWYGGRYLANVAGEEPNGAAQLYEAAACYARQHDLMWRVWACVGGNGRSRDRAERFKDASVRRQMVELVREAKQHDERAIEHIEAAIEQIEK